MPNRNIKIVVVDDDAHVNQALKRLLTAAGFHAITYASAEALLECDGASNAACMVLDVNLPGLSGFELQRRLEQSGHLSPVIFITAYDDSGSQADAQGRRPAGYLAKPFYGQDLLNIIFKTLGTKMPERVSAALDRSAFKR